MYVSDIVEKLKSLSKKEKSSFEDSINSYVKNNKLSIFKPSNINDAMVCFKISFLDDKLKEECNTINLLPDEMIYLSFVIRKIILDETIPIKLPFKYEQFDKVKTYFKKTVLV